MRFFSWTRCKYIHNINNEILLGHSNGFEYENGMMGEAGYICVPHRKNIYVFLGFEPRPASQVQEPGDWEEEGKEAGGYQVKR